MSETVNGLSPCEVIANRYSAMETERSSFISHWQELSAYVRPRMGRFFVTDRNRGTKKYGSIINSRGTQSHRTCQNGLFAGVMSPTRPWFNLTTPDPDMMSYQPVLEWLYKVEQLMYAIFASGNLYNMAPTMIGELVLFGTGAMSQMDDFDNVARFYTHTVGSYVLAQNDKFQVDTIGRKFQMSARQLVAAYGTNVSPTVRTAYDNGNYDSWFDVIHFVEPNLNADPSKLASKFKAYRSIYMEPNAPKFQGFLEQKGFDEFPAHCPRWEVTGEDIYGTDCPGMTTLGDVKGLQALERRTAQAIDKMVDPPLSGPPSLRNVGINSLPGGSTLYEGGDGKQKLEPIYTVMPQLNQHLEVVKHHEQRIKEGYYEDLFRSIDSMEGVQPQNQMYLSQKNAEKLLQLGPVLERIHGEGLNRIVDRTFAQCVAAKLPLMMQAPPELQGQPLRVKYISSLAMAQRSVANAGIDKLTMFIGGLMKGGMTTAMDSFDVDAAVHEYARNDGVPPKLIIPQEKVDAARAAHQKQVQQAQQAQMAQQVATAANQGSQAVANIADAPAPNGGSVLGNVAAAAQQRQGGGGPPV